MNKRFKALSLGLLMAGLAVTVVACKPAATESHVEQVVIVEVQDRSAEYMDAALSAWTDEQVNAVLVVIQENFAQGRYDGFYSEDDRAMISEEAATGSVRVFVVVLDDLLQEATAQGADVDAYLAANFAPELVDTIKAGLPTYAEIIEANENEYTYS